jgi:hypothetical protein
MTKVYFFKMEVNGSTFFRGIWFTIEEAMAWVQSYRKENKRAKITATLEVMHVMSSSIQR